MSLAGRMGAVAVDAEWEEEALGKGMIVLVSFRTLASEMVGFVILCMSNQETSGTMQ
jgi:hypothetical protein